MKTFKVGIVALV